ncbi:MAG: DUF2617 family protein [Planctomycetota bacterium]|nr:DUF2617 family protein [Planctomycetota bacterium]
MNIPPKSNVLQGYQVVLYSRALHPELFQLKGRKVVRDEDYELEAWVLPGQHALRFEHRALCVSELVTDSERGVPQQGIVSAFLCAGERDFEHQFPQDKVNYMTTVQTESLSESLYSATFNEMLDYSRQHQSLSHRWRDEAGACLSVIDIQRMSREVHVQSYHLIASAGLVLRTQTIFEVK